MMERHESPRSKSEFPVHEEKLKKRKLKGTFKNNHVAPRKEFKGRKRGEPNDRSTRL